MYCSRYTISCCRPLNLETISKKEAAITAICGNRHVKLLNVDNWTRFHRGDRFVPDNYSEIIADRAIVHAETGASNDGYPKVCKDFTIMEKAPIRAFSWLKALLRHYAKQVLTSR